MLVFDIPSEPSILIFFEIFFHCETLYNFQWIVLFIIVYIFTALYDLCVLLKPYNKFLWPLGNSSLKLKNTPNLWKEVFPMVPKGGLEPPRSEELRILSYYQYILNHLYPSFNVPINHWCFNVYNVLLSQFVIICF